MGQYCPIRIPSSGDTAFLSKGIHIDLYRFLKNPSIRLYALSGAYERSNLDSISKGLLKMGKLELSTDISDLPYYELAHYCWRDANITLRITSYEDNLILRLIVLLMRISRLSMEDVTRLGISSWIQSVFRQEHRSNDYLVPRQSDIKEAKSEEAHTEAVIKDKAFKGAIVIEPVAGVHFNATVLDFASLYPTIMKRHNISYETVDCPHETCKADPTRRVPQTGHWTCKERKGMISQTIGFFRDTRVRWFKSKSKDMALDEHTRNWYTVVEKALKVFVNACLPFDEEVVVRSTDGIVKKCKIGSLENSWSDFEILSVHNEIESPQFGKPTFTPIIGFRKSTDSQTLKFNLDDGRVFQCTPNHMIPKLIRSPTRSKKHKSVEAEYDVVEVSAEDIEIGDDVLILGTNYFSNTPPQHIFIPDCINPSHLTVGMKRKDFKRFAYRKGQSVDYDLIQVIIDEFRYSKVSKMYKARWKDLSESAKEIIRRDANSVVPLYVKMTVSTEQYHEAGKWQRVTILLDDDFFSLMGWYLSEGHVGVNRVSFSQYLSVHPQNFQEICTTLTTLGWSYATYSEKDIVVHSNILAAVFENLCGIGSENKRIPIELLDHQRAITLLDSYFKGDGNFNIRGGRRYSTVSEQLANDLVFLLGALGRYVSIHHSEGIFRIVETKGYKYKRKHQGLVCFGSSLAVRVKSIEMSESIQPVFDVETGNGWFVTTNGVIVHNSYGVTGAQHFELFCLPAAESVTAYGRDAIIRTKEKAESMGIRVLYGDTDSVFLDNPSEEQQKEIIAWSTTDLGIDLEAEKTYKYVALSSRKKNYIGVYYSGYVEVKGLSGKKRNTPDFAQDAFRQMLEVLSKVDNVEGFEAAKEEIRKIVYGVIDRLEGKADPYSPDELAFRVQMTKSLGKYGKTKPQHVRAALVLQKSTKQDIPAGTIVEYIKVRGDPGVLPVQLAGDTAYWIDKDKYIETLRSVFEQVLDSVGIDFEELLGFTTLDEFF